MSGRKPIRIEAEPRVRAALEHFPLRDQVAFQLRRHTGFRATELLALNVDDVTDQGRIHEKVTVAHRCL